MIKKLTNITMKYAHTPQLQEQIAGVLNEEDQYDKFKPPTNLNFKTEAELMRWLLDGGKIAPKLGPDKDEYIHLVNGFRQYKNGESACNCLISLHYWRKYIDYL